jgi:hypothetical protein
MRTRIEGRRTMSDEDEIAVTNDERMLFDWLELR